MTCIREAELIEFAWRWEPFGTGDEWIILQLTRDIPIDFDWTRPDIRANAAPATITDVVTSYLQR